MRFVLLGYMVLGLLVLAIGHRKWWAETDELVELSIQAYEKQHGEKTDDAWRTFTWVATVVLSLCFDWPLWPRAAWRWWLRGSR